MFYLFTLWIIYCICFLICKFHIQGFHTVDFQKFGECNFMLQLSWFRHEVCQYHQDYGLCDVMPCSLIDSWRWRHQVHLEWWFLSVKLHGIIPYSTNNIWNFNVYNLMCTCIVCIEVHVIRNSIHHHSVLYLISLLTFCIDILYSTFSFPSVLHTHKNILIYLTKYNNINHSWVICRYWQGTTYASRSLLIKILYQNLY